MMDMGLGNIFGVGVQALTSLGKGVGGLIRELVGEMTAPFDREKEGSQANQEPQDSVNINFDGIQNEASPMNLPQLGWLNGGQ